VKPCVRPRWVAGIIADAGAAIEELTPGIDLFAAAAEHESVAALEPYHGLACQGVADQLGVDLALLHPASSGNLRGVNHQSSWGELAQHRYRSEPVGDDDVGAGDGVAPRDREQTWITGAAADQDDPTDPWRVAGCRWLTWRRTGGGTVGDAEHAAAAGCLDDRGVQQVVVGTRENQCGRGDVCDGEVSVPDRDLPSGSQVGQVRRWFG
jgi:hypothetical protein